MINKLIQNQRLFLFIFNLIILNFNQTYFHKINSSEFNERSLTKLIYICNTIFILDSDQNLHTYSFI